MTRTVIYSRQSLDDEKQKNSTAVQKAKCLQYAQKHGWLVHEYLNEGQKSARLTTIDERPAITRLLFEAAKGNITRLIVYKRDRLARNVEQYMKILHQLQKAKVAIFFAADNEPPLMTGPIGEFIEVILAGLAQQEGENIHRRQRETRQHLMSKGLKPGGKMHYGYVTENKVIKKVQEEAEIIEEIYMRFIRCWSINKDLKEIVHAMNQVSPLIMNETRVIKETGKSIITDTHVNSQKIKEIIPRPIHRGYLVQKEGGETYPYQNEDWRIVSDQVWTEANEYLEALGFKPKEESEEKYVPHLVNKVVCGKCSDSGPNRRLFNTRTKYYVCPDCNRKLHIEDFDRFVLDQTIQHLQSFAVENMDSIQKIIEHYFLYNPEKDEKELKTNLSAIERAIQKQVMENINGSECLESENLNTLVENYKDILKSLKAKQEEIFQLRHSLSKGQGSTFIYSLQRSTLQSFEEDILFGTIKEVVYANEAQIHYLNEEGKPHEE